MNTQNRNIGESWKLFVQEHEAVSETEGAEVWLRFEQEILTHCEFLESQNEVVGIVIQGIGLSFVKRIVGQMEVWKMPQASIDHFEELTGLFDYNDLTIHLEWISPNKNRITFDIRQQSEVPKILQYYRGIGVDPRTLEKVHLLSRLINKNTFQVISGTMMSQEDLSHQLGFSQFVDKNTYSEVFRHILALLEFFDMDPNSRNLLCKYHSNLVDFNLNDNLSLYLSFSKKELKSTLILDYPRVSFEAIPGLATQHELLSNQLTQFGIRTNQENLSKLRIHFFKDNPLELTFYAG